MMDTRWSVEPINRHVASAFNTATAEGHSHGDIFEAFLAAALSGMQYQHGSRNVSRRLYVLAMKFAEEADRQEGASAGSGGLVH